MAQHHTQKLLLGRLMGAALLGSMLLHSPTAEAKDLPQVSPARVGLSSDGLARLDAKMHSYVDDGTTGGVVTLIARHGKIAHFDAYGWADRADQTPMRKDTNVRMYSMTKPITSVALLMLYEEGHFQLTDPLEKYIPEMAGVKVFTGRDRAGKMILETPNRRPTIQDVFRHTAGFTYGNFEDEVLNARWSEEKIAQEDQAIFVKKLATYPLAYQPGEKWIYSVSHDVQAYLVEHFSGMSFAEFCRTRIFEPLDMSNTYFGFPDGRPENYATLYLADNEGNVVPEAWDEAGLAYGAAVLGGSGLSSNARDYLQFAQMLLNGGELNGTRLLGPKTVKFMSTNHLPEGMQVGRFKGRGYGLGVSVITNPTQIGLPMSVGEFGWSGAATTYFSVNTEEDMVVLLITQIRPTSLPLWQDIISLSHMAIID